MSRLTQVVRCQRCGIDYRAFTPAEARSELCDACADRLVLLLGILVAMLAGAVAIALALAV